MDTKLCSKCEKLKVINDFYLRKKGKRAGKYYETCKDCFRERGRDYYSKTRERQLELVKIRSKRYLIDRLMFLAAIKNSPCKDCGKCYPPWIMDFDHRDGKSKISNVSTGLLRRLWDLEKTKKEISKCDLICANCHRMRTYEKSGKNYSIVIERMRSEGYRFEW